METSSSDYMSGSNGIFLIISIVSWISVLVTGFMSFGVPKMEMPDIDIDTFKFKTIKMLYTWLNFYILSKDLDFKLPVTINYVLFYIMVALTLLFLVLSLAIYIYGILTRNGNILNGMLGNFTKFHFVPLLCVSCLFIIGETLDIDRLPKGVHYFFSLVFTIIGLGSLVFITMQTNIESPNYASWIIKHGAYSCLIPWLVYNLCYLILYYHLSVTDDDNDSNDSDKWVKGCEIAFAIIIGIINLCLAIFLKAVMIAFTNLLIYIGMVCRFFDNKKDEIKATYGSYTGGIIEIIMMILSLLVIVFLIIQYRKPS